MTYPVHLRDFYDAVVDGCLLVTEKQILLDEILEIFENWDGENISDVEAAFKMMEEDLENDPLCHLFAVRDLIKAAATSRAAIGDHQETQAPVTYGGSLPLLEDRNGGTLWFDPSANEFKAGPAPGMFATP